MAMHTRLLALATAVLACFQKIKIIRIIITLNNYFLFTNII